MQLFDSCIDICWVSFFHFVYVLYLFHYLCSCVLKLFLHAKVVGGFC